MRVVLAFDKFKGTFSAHQVCEIVADGIRDRNPKIEVIMRPLADGGEGSGEILASTLGLDILRTEAWDLLEQPVDGKIYWQNSRRLLILEAADLLGSSRSFPDEDSLLKGNSWGLGKLIQKSFLLRPQELWLCNGGTLTADLGWGIASAFNLVAFDNEGNELKPSLKNMGKVDSFTLGNLPEYLKKTRFNLLCDVNAPVLSTPSSSQVSLFSFLPQKGAKQENIEQYKKNIVHFHKKLKSQFNHIANLEDPFTGAGGGLMIGASVIFPQITPEMGAKTIAKATALQSSLSNANLVVCGEGCLDELTFSGKCVSTVAEEAHKGGYDLHGIFGKVKGPSADFKIRLGLQNITVIVENPNTLMSTNELIRFSKNKLYEAGQQIADKLSKK